MKYVITLDYVTTADILIEAGSSQEAEELVWRKVHTDEGFKKYIEYAAPRNVILEGDIYIGDGFEVANVEVFKDESNLLEL